MEDGRWKDSRVFHPLLVAITFAGMLIWSWGTWPDPLVDYGMDLYIPWQLSAGKVLYRDIAYFNGPFSNYFNAAIFKIAGVGLHTLEAANLLILAGVMGLIYRLMLRASGRRAALMGGLTIALVFAFGQGVGIGNYNWVTPYVHELTHGVALGLIAIACLDRFGRQGRIGWLIGAGAAVGCAFLTKAEVSTAVAVAAVAQLLAMCWMTGPSAAKILRFGGIFLASALAAPVLAGALLCLVMPAREAITGLFGSWPWLFDRRITSLPFYRGLIGLDDVPGNLWIMLYWTLGYAGVLGPAILIALLARRGRWMNSIGIFAVLSGLFAWNFFQIDWNAMITPLPICVAVAAIITGIAVLRRRPETDRARAALRLGLVVFSLVLLAKMLFKPHVFHYGFVLAMPATLVLVAAVAEDIPGWIERRGGSAQVLRAAGLAAWLAGVAACLFVDSQYFQSKQWWIRAGTPESFRGSARALEVEQLCNVIDQQLPANGSLAVFPQGLMVNYLTRRPTSIPYINFMPPEVLSIGEEKILAALDAHPPDAIVLDNSAIQNGQFTLDRQYGYGKRTYDWIKRNYQPIATTHLPSPLLTPYQFILLVHKPR